MLGGFTSMVRRSSLAVVRTLMLARLLVLTICLAIAGVGYVTNQHELVRIFGALNVVIFLSIIYFILLKFITGSTRVYWFIFFQLFIDVMTATVLVFFTGGVSSPFTFLFFLVILASALIFGFAASMLFTSFSVVMMSVITIMYRFDFGPPDWTQFFPGMEPRESVSALLSHAFGFFLLAALVSVLSEHLTRARLLHALMLERIADGVLLFDSRGNLQTRNDTAAAIIETLGIPSSGEGSDFERVVGIPKMKVAADSDGLEGYVIEKNAGDRVFTFQCMRTDEINGLPAGFLVTITDMTSERKLSEARVKMERMRAFSELGAGIAHEIRNPLATIRGSVQELDRMAPELGNKFKKLAGMVIRESDRINRIITDFLKYARMKKPTPEIVRVEEHADEYYLMLANRDDARGVEISVNVEADPVMCVDHEQFRQILLNLAVNAFQMLKDKDSPRIEISFRKVDGDWVEFTVRDNGPGVPEDRREKIFTPFFTTRTEGSGLGLALVRRILEINGGWIEYEEGPGGGACFRGRLPSQDRFSKSDRKAAGSSRRVMESA